MSRNSGRLSLPRSSSTKAPRAAGEHWQTASFSCALSHLRRPAASMIGGSRRAGMREGGIRLSVKGSIPWLGAPARALHQWPRRHVRLSAGAGCSQEPYERASAQQARARDEHSMVERHVEARLGDLHIMSQGLSARFERF